MRPSHVVLSLTLVLPLVIAAPAPFYEDWGTPAWTLVSGSGIDQACDGASCYLSALPPCCGGGHARYRHGLSTAVTDDPSISFRFWGASTAGDSDALLQLAFDNTSHLHVELTEAPGNNRVALHTTGNAQAFAGYWSASAWYTARVAIDGTARTATLTLSDASGAVIGSAGPTPLPTGATRLSYVDFQAIRWSGPAVEYRFDDIEIDVGGAPIFSDSFSPSALTGWDVEGSARRHCIVGLPACSLELTPACCSAYVRVTRQVSTADGVPFRVEFDFLPPLSSYSSIDAVVQLRLDHGDLNIQLTEGSTNRQVSILSTLGTSAAAGTWSPGQWTHASVTVDPTLHTASLEIDPAGGEPLLPAITVLYPDATHLTAASFQGVRWNAASTGTFHYDNVAIEEI